MIAIEVFIPLIALVAFLWLSYELGKTRRMLVVDVRSHFHCLRCGQIKPTIEEYQIDRWPLRVLRGLCYDCYADLEKEK